MKVLNLKKFVILSMCVGALFFQSCKKDDVVTPDQTPNNNTAFKEQMRYLWSDHAVWTRDVIVAILDQSPVAEASLNRLLANQVDIGNAIKPYYGGAGGQVLTDLLTEHIVVAGDLLVAARDGDASFDEEKARWYKNGDDIAIFLNSANPENWGLEHMKQHMKDHLDFTLAEAVAHLQGNYPAEIKAYDSVYEQLMNMSDLIADGIVKQFPEKF